MKAVSDDKDDYRLALEFSSQASKNTLSYTMRWPEGVGMQWTDATFPQGSRPRITRGSSNVPDFDFAETHRTWPLMYAVFKEHLKFFGVSDIHHYYPGLRFLLFSHHYT